VSLILFIVAVFYVTGFGYIISEICTNFSKCTSCCDG